MLWVQPPLAGDDALCREQFMCPVGCMRGFHDFVVVAISDEAGASEFTSRVSDVFALGLVLGIKGDPQNQLGDRQQLRVELQDLGKNRVFKLALHGRRRLSSKSPRICFRCRQRLRVAQDSSV